MMEQQSEKGKQVEQQQPQVTKGGQQGGQQGQGSQQGQGQGGQLQQQQQQQRGLQQRGGGGGLGGGWLSEIDPFMRSTAVDPLSAMDELLTFGNELFPSRMNLFPRGRRGRRGLQNLLDVPQSFIPLTSIQFPTEIKEDNQGYHLAVDAPGINKQDIKIHVDGNTINIRGQRHEEKEKDENVSGTVYHTKEISRGSFSRSFTLPDDAEMEKISNASVENGVLKLDIPKSPAKQEKHREIQIQ